MAQIIKLCKQSCEAFSQRHFQGNKVSGSVEKFYLQPLTKAHLYSDYEYEIGNTASATVVWSMLIIASLIIVIAWVNYINLATAKSSRECKRSWREKSFRRNKNSVDKTISNRISHHQYYCFMYCVVIGCIGAASF